HTHMKMTGMWHVYRPGERWWHAPSKARVVVRTDAYVAVCFTPPIVELFAAGEAALHPLLPALGPDVIADGFDLAEGIRRVHADRARLSPRRVPQELVLPELPKGAANGGCDAGVRAIGQLDRLVRPRRSPRSLGGPLSLEWLASS